MDEDFSMFTLEELFADEQQRDARESVEDEFRRSDSLNPLDHLIRSEERDTLKRYTRRLQDFLFTNLDSDQKNFLINTLGKHWDLYHRLPSEFRHFSSAEFERYLLDHREEIEEKIDILVRHCATATYKNMTAAALEFTSIPFNLTPERKVIEIYDAVCNTSLERYPFGFFHIHNRRIPRILTRHLVDDVLALPHTEKTLKDLTPDIFRENELSFMLQQYYGGTVRRAVHDAYTREQFPAAYSTQYETDDVLREVFMRLRSANGKTPTLKQLFDHDEKKHAQ